MTERRYKRESDQFEAQDDEGNLYTVIEYQLVIESEPISGPSSIMKGTKELFLGNGRAVNYIDDDTFEVVETEKIIRRV